ncbi:MAG: carboxypeptidase-like regulatory domain-containing protein [Cyclobacteriaceae bacterium]|nr:carboxypeptidase-like regulatory domain-containing protein [Cyclobacteriaceae bacterium HetDA_MAG_MS6]
MHSKFFSLLLILFCSSKTFAQEYILTGKVVDENGKGLPFATLYLEGTTNGTTANRDGDFQLKTATAKHMLHIRFVGYQQQAIPVSGSTNLGKITMKPEILQLRAVTVTADQENPAVRIIRETIKKRKYHLNEVKAYQCDVYIKGHQRLDDRPDKILGITIDVDTGIVYLSESISELHYERPDKFFERMISSKVSGDNNAFSWNQASDMLLDFYENNFAQEGFNERPIVSPIASNAFFFYNYKLEGYFQEGDHFINKIRVIPKRRTDPVFSGYIYIVEDQWRIHSVDLLLTRDRGIEFLDSVKVHQVYAPAQYDIWMPISQDLQFDFKAFGFKGSGHFVGIYSKYELEPNYEYYQKKAKGMPKFEEDHEKVDLFQKKDFNNGIMVVEEDANKKDSIYWIEVRPMPLSPLEERDYFKKDSIKIIKESKPYKDSVDARNNKLKTGNIFFSGYTYQNSFKEFTWSTPSILQTFTYNTVEGFAPTATVTYRKTKDQRTVFAISPTFRYGFANEQFQAKVEGEYQWRDKRFTRVRAGFGRYVSQFKKDGAIGEFPNTIFTMLQGNNYMKLYQKDFFVYSQFRQEIKNGLMLTTSLSYEKRSEMDNMDDFTFSNESVANITSNQPINNGQEVTMAEHGALIAEVQARIRIGQRYIDRPDRKVILETKFPDITLTYRKGIPLNTGDANFDEVKATISDNLTVGLGGNTQFLASAGYFLSNQEVEFPDFHHFSGNRTYLANFGRDHFQLLDYYQHSTDDSYFEAHLEHHFNEFVLNILPWINRLNWQTVLSVNYLTTPELKSYFEFGVGIEHIFKIMRVDYYRSYDSGNFTSEGIRVGFGF